MKGFEWKGRECVVDITKKKKATGELEGEG